jgi:hypothetical protein
MSESMQKMSKLFSIVFDALGSMDDHEIDLLTQGKATLRVVEKNKSKKTMPLDDSCLDVAISDIAQKLNATESREAAANLLASINQPQKKDFLLLLAKSCGVRVESRDSIVRIEEKLVENVVGARLDSEAMRKVAF